MLLLTEIAFVASIVQASNFSPLINRASRNTFEWDKIKRLIAFGDSYTYVQGTHGYQNFSFIGDFLPGEFEVTPSELWSDQIEQNFLGTAEGGANWVEFLTGCALKPGLTSPSTCDTQLWDFAFAGADVSEQYTSLHHPWTVPLVNQTQQFLTWIEPQFQQANFQQSEALVAIWIGINDIGDTSTWTNISYFPNLYEEIIGTVFSSSAELIYQAGYRNFLFINLPPLQRTPLNWDAADPRPNKTMVDWWNGILEDKKHAFGQQYQDVNAFYYDANTYLNHILDNPSDYGIKNVTSYCPGYTNPDVVTDPEKYGCIPIDEYFWFNTGHMTSHVHSFLGPEIGDFLRQQSQRG